MSDHAGDEAVDAREGAEADPWEDEADLWREEARAWEDTANRWEAAANRWEWQARRWEAAAKQWEGSLRSLQAGTAWRVAGVLQEAGRRHPWLARQVRRLALVVWWTARGQLLGRLRLWRQAQAEARAAPAGPAATSPVRPDSPGRAPALAEATEQRARPVSTPEPAAEEPLVSVVIVAPRFGRFIVTALESALAQTVKDLEVIVVVCETQRPAAGFSIAGLQRPRTRVVPGKSGNSLGANRNLGVSLARGRYVCCIDADDVLAATYVEKAVFLLERHGYDVVSGALRAVNDDGRDAVLPEPDLAALLNHNQLLASAVFRRSLWQAAGGYREAEPGTDGEMCEDWAFWLRLAAFGARFRNLPHDPTMRYRLHHGRGGRAVSIDDQRARVRRLNADVLPNDDGTAAPLRVPPAPARHRAPGETPVPLVLDRTPSGPQPPTLLLAMPFLVLGGSQRLMSNVVAHLVRTGWRVVITTSVDPGPASGNTLPWFEPHTAEIFQLPRDVPPELWEDFLHHLVGSRGVDVLWVVGSAVAYDSLPGLRAAYPALRVADLLFNTVGHTASNHRYRRSIDLVFVENKEVEDWLIADGEQSSRICLVESGVDVAALRPRARSEALVHQIGATPNELIVGFAGRWSAEKGPLNFVAIAQAVDAALPVRFVMAGAGPLKGAVEQAVRDAGFPDGRFHLLGEIAEIAPVLASFDLLVVPSVLDGRPLVVLEALALGVPVLASRVGGLPDLVQDGDTGWLCEPDDTKGFTARIETAARGGVDLPRMRLRAREYAEARLDVARMLTAYETRLRSLLPGGLAGG